MSDDTIYTRMPSYEELIARTDAPARSTWGLFGDDDELGTVNFLTDQRVLAGTAAVERGQVFNLDYPINAFDPPISRGLRKLAKHTIYSRHDDHRDDYVDGLYLQATTQFDGLRHRRHNEHGFYNHTSPDAITEGTTELGIQNWAEHGIVGRGVLIDVERWSRTTSTPLDPTAATRITVDMIEQTLAHQGTELEPGDIVLLRTGWCGHYFALNRDEKIHIATNAKCSGLAQSDDSLAWIWDNRISVLAADNVALEASPATEESPFESPTDKRNMHQQMIALMGLAVGELFRLDDLAEDCAADGKYTFMVSASPLNFIGAVGSPPNAVAIK